ncbi:hypothetical protein CQW23_25026 [Capsicum baccatum]|uniref:Uncharacterized protein n=1 Tax=Capsicum baccatum TaxID=33114 RepID=A0A2G2VWH1_CAPBA|nr:hypothetical protein CQW23_25026 [Capsicum baccatum]
MTDSSAREMNERQPQRPCGCITDENSGCVPNAKNNGMIDTLDESKREMKAQILVARLMDLESKQAGSRKDKVLAESVDSVNDELLFPEPDRDLSDCETSLFTRRSCRERIHNVSGVLSKIDQLKRSKLSYAK